MVVVDVVKLIELVGGGGKMGLMNESGLHDVLVYRQGPLYSGWSLGGVGGVGEIEETCCLRERQQSGSL